MLDGGGFIQEAQALLFVGSVASSELSFLKRYFTLVPRKFRMNLSSSVRSSVTSVRDLIGHLLKVETLKNTIASFFSLLERAEKAENTRSSGWGASKRLYGPENILYEI